MFIKAIGYRISSNNLRSLIETEAERALRAAIITQAEKTAIENVVGHNRATCLNDYVLYNMIDDVIAAYAALCSLGSFSTGPAPHFITQSPVVPVYCDAHPVKDNDPKVPYTKEEKGIVGVIVEWVRISFVIYQYLYLLTIVLLLTLHRSLKNGLI